MKEQLFRFRSFWIFPLLAILLLVVTFGGETSTRWMDLAWLFPLGLLLWSLLEYGLHRFVFHIRFSVRDPGLREILNASHLSHHAAPRDPGKLLVDPLYGLAISAILFVLLLLAFGDTTRAVGVLVGIWAGFLCYEVVHYRVHMAATASGLLAWQRRAHFYHHFSNRERCFGVTTPLWDYVFRTELPRPRR